MARIRILDPTAPPPDVNPDPGPAAGKLRGRRVGLRHDPTWRSFEWVMAEWTRAFGEAGAEVHPWSAGARVGPEGEQTARELAGFVDEVDLAVLGLGN